MHVIGYWIESLRDDAYFPPQELVGELPAQTREHLAAYLDRGSEFVAYRGISWCRFGCQHADMGSRDLTDGQWVWPEGLSHYVREHGITLPSAFLQHVLAGGSRMPDPMPDEMPSDALWRDWCSATSSRHLQPALADARARAHARAQELREADWKRREAELGLPQAKCMHRDCAHMALAGMAICAMHEAAQGAYDPGSTAYFTGLVDALKV